MAALRFLVFYTIFILFISWVSAQAGTTIFSNSEDMQNLVADAPANYYNPIWYIGALGAFMSLSTEFTLVYIVMITPLIIGIVYIVAATLSGSGA